MKHKVITNNAAKLFRHLTDQKKEFFMFRDVEQYMNDLSKAYLNEFLNELVGRELIMRLKKGVYVMIPYNIPAEDYFPDSNVVGANLVGDASYYIGYFSALQLHSLTTQPNLRTQIVVNKRVVPAIREVHGIKFQFIYHRKDSFFGTKRVWPDPHHKVICSDLEKTLIDCLYKPDYAQGITEVAKALYKARRDLKWDKLLKYVKKFDKQAVIKRLGFLLELFGIDAPILNELNEMRSSSYLVLDSTYPKSGKTQSRWRIQINFDLETIKQAPFT